jgi:hypothetical protein
MQEQTFDKVSSYCQRPVNLSSWSGQTCLAYIVRLYHESIVYLVYDRFLLHEAVNMAHDHSLIAVR